MQQKHQNVDAESVDSSGSAKKKTAKSIHSSRSTPSVVSKSVPSNGNRGNQKPTSSTAKKPASERPSVSSNYSDTPKKKLKILPKQEESDDEIVMLNHHTSRNHTTTSVGKLEEIHIPIWTPEFMEWNAKREKELKQLRHAADDLDIDIAGIRLQQEQIQKCADEVADSKKKLEDIRKAKKAVKKIIHDGLSGVKLTSGLQINDSNMKEYLTEIEKILSRTSGRHSELTNRMKNLAKELQPYASFL